jgi:hypothetical protein
VTVGWVGIVYGISGLNERGVGVACNPSDTLDNSVVGSVLDQVVDLSKAKLLASGLPVGFIVKRVLEKASTAQEGAEAIAEVTARPDRADALNAAAAAWIPGWAPVAPVEST